MADAGSAPQGQPPGAAAAVVVEFIDVDGTPGREQLGFVERGVRAGSRGLGFASFLGQCSRPGLWWFATTGDLVRHLNESWLDRDG